MTLRERRARLARRLLETRPNRPPFAEPERWRRHHGQRWFTGGLLLDGAAMAEMTAHVVAMSRRVAEARSRPGQGFVMFTTDAITDTL